LDDSSYESSNFFYGRERQCVVQTAPIKRQALQKKTIGINKVMSKKIPDAIDKFVGHKIKMRRVHLGLNQTQLAEPLGLTYQQVQKYEVGTSRIGASRLQQIAQVLQVSVSYFFEGAPSAHAKADSKNTKNGIVLPDYAKTFISTDEGLAIAKAFSKIENTEIKDCIANLIQFMADADLRK
jgi:transcriptional regulator with XRE-family HTH domain